MIWLGANFFQLQYLKWWCKWGLSKLQRLVSQNFLICRKTPASKLIYRLCRLYPILRHPRSKFANVFRLQIFLQTGLPTPIWCLMLVTTRIESNLPWWSMEKKPIFLGNSCRMTGFPWISKVGGQGRPWGGMVFGLIGSDEDVSNFV